jgi:hypothetical protein
MGEKRDQGSVPGEPEGRAHSERFEDHPTPEELSAYQAGELTPEQSDAIQEHLAGCELCTEVLLDLHRFLDLPPEDRPREGVVDLQTETEWRALRAKLPLGGQRRSIGSFAAVAAILLAAIGFFVLSRGGSPRYQTLDPYNGYRGSNKVQTVYLPVILRLKPVSDQSFPQYQANLQTRARTRIQNFPGLEQTSSYDIEIPLNKRDLDPGEYTIDLFGIRNGTSTLVGTYVFKVIAR